MSNLNKFRKSTVAVLTALLIIAIAAPLVSFASAGAATASLGTTVGPNGTLVKVQGAGFGANRAVGDITITVDGLSGKVITTTGTAPLGGSATIGTDYQLKTDSNGVLTGYFVIYGLSVGAHTVIITDASTSVVAGTFTIKAPTATVTPSALTAGSSVTITASGFPTSSITIESAFANTITSASFSNNTITVASGRSTSNSSVLSSNQLNSGFTGSLGTYTGTVSLPALSSGSGFTLTDAWGNTATTGLSLTTPTVVLSPSSGPVGTTVTATVTGFGPASTISSVQVGNIAAHRSTATITPVAPATTEQGSSVFLFTIPAGANATQSGAAGTQVVTVVDANGNVGTAVFTVTPKVTITLGTAGVDSGTTSVPASTSAVIRLSVSGFKANTPLTIGYSPNVPTEWTSPTSSWSPNTAINTYNQILTDANGAVATITSIAGISPTSKGQYWISISDGTNTVTTTINVVAPGDIMATPVSSGASGQTGVQIAYFGTSTPTGVTLGGITASATGLAPAQAWPTATLATFTVPTTSAGVHTLALVGGSFNTVPFTTISSSITVISPSASSVGTTVTVVGNGFANNAAILQIQGATFSIATADVVGNTLLVTFAVPNYVPGTYTLSLSDSANTATTSFTVTSAQIKLTPDAGTPTDARGNANIIAITGSGFKANDTLTVKFDNQVITAARPVGLTVVNTNGGILINSGFQIPTATTAGTHQIAVIGASGAYAQVLYTIIPQLASLPAVRPGAAVAITGAGFGANSVQSLTVNGTATTWLNVGVSPVTALPSGTSVQTQANGNLYTTQTVGFVVPATETSTALEVKVTDALGNTATTILTILGTPAIKVGSTNIVAGTTAAMGVSINGTGFTPSSLRTTTPISAQLLQGSTIVATVALSTATTTVGSSGSFPPALSPPITFTIPAYVPAGEYTLQFQIGTAGVSTPVETATTTVNVLGAPKVEAPSTVVSGSNVTIAVTGLTAISTATFSNTDLIATSAFGPVTITNTGADAYTKTTWFVVPTGLFAGTYLLTLIDSNTGLTCQTAITVAPSITVNPTIGSKGQMLTVTGTGFASSSTLTAKVNGVAVVLSATQTNSTGAIVTATFNIPVTAVATNTLSITDAIGNTATATFNVTAPQIQIAPTPAAAGSTVQIIGSGFTINSPIVIQVNGQVITTVPASLSANAGGSFITYITLPAGLTGNVTVTATDNSNNVGTAILPVGGSTGDGVPNQSTMTSTAQTTTPSGTATTTFTAGSTAKASFMLQSTSGSREVVVVVTWQQGAQVYNMASVRTTMTTTASPVEFTNLLPAGATGTWTAVLQVFAADGVTPLAVTTLTFTVS